LEKNLSRSSGELYIHKKLRFIETYVFQDAWDKRILLVTYILSFPNEQVYVRNCMMKLLNSKQAT
jgi:hypothetical protein